MQKEFWLLYTWDLTAEEEAMIENSSLGDQLSINAPLLPAVFQDENDYCLLAFSDEEMITEEYLSEYAIVKDTLDSVVVKMIAVSRILGKMPLLVIDPDQECETEYDLTQLQEMASPS